MRNFFGENEQSVNLGFSVLLHTQNRQNSDNHFIIHFHCAESNIMPLLFHNLGINENVVDLLRAFSGGDELYQPWLWWG